MGSILEKAINEIELLERELEEAVSEESRQDILSAIRNIERELRR